MELTTLLGILVGIGAIIGAMFFKHIPFSVFINPAATLVIFAGTASSVLNAFTGRELKNLGKLFKILFTSKKEDGVKKIIEMFMEFAVIVRKDGLLALESKLANVDDPFIIRALKMVMDGANEEYVYEVLTADIESMESRHNTNASIFSQAGMYAPTLGVLGAVFGLIAAMSHIEEVELMAEAVAAAFIATILGIFTGYVLWNPFANKLKMKSKREVFERTLVIEGILSLQKGEAPARIKDKLLAMISETERAKYGTDD